VSRAVRMGIGLVSLIPVIGIAGAVLVAVGVEGLAVGWLALGIGVVWFALVMWWATRVPAAKRTEDRNWGVFGSTRFR
jgi:hypothetical protein